MRAGQQPHQKIGNRERGHDDLGAEPECEQGERSEVEPSARRTASAPLGPQEQEERSKVESGSERFRTLGYVDHRLGLQRMQGKHGGYSQGEEVQPGRAAKPENLTREEEDQQRGGEVDGQIRQVKGQRRRSRSPIVDGKGEIGENALAVYGVEDRGRREEVREMPNAVAELHRVQVIEL